MSNLRDKIKQVAAQSAPTMVPTQYEKPAPPPIKEEEVVPQLSDVVKDRKKALEVSQLAAKCGELGIQISALNKIKKPLAAKLKVLVGKLGVGKALAGEWKINYYSAPRAYIVADMLRDALLARGMQPKDIVAIIDESTKKSEGYTLKVSAVGQEEDED